MKHAIAYLLLASTALAAEPYPVGCLVYTPPQPVVSFQPQSFSEMNGPFTYHVGTDLIIKETDGTERTLVVGNQPDKGLLAVHDWCVSLDGTKVYYSHVRKDGTLINCDLFVIPAAGGEPTQLTSAKDEWQPPSGVFPAVVQSVWNAHPCDTPEGLIFSSTRNGVKMIGDNLASFQLFRLNGSDVTKIGHLNLGGVLHPHYWNGRIYFATGEQQGRRASNGGGWGIWSIKSDGTDWQPEQYAPTGGSVGYHDTTHSSNGSQFWSSYYDTRAFGHIYGDVLFLATPFGPPTPFGDPSGPNNPFVWAGWDDRHGRVRSGNFRRFPFQRRGQFGLLPWAHIQDELNTNQGHVVSDPATVLYQREVGQPWGVPGNGVLLTWTGQNPARRDLGVYLADAGRRHYPTDAALPSEKPLDYLTPVIDVADRHEWYGKAIVPYAAIYGTPAPAMTPSPVATELPDGSPYCVFGSTSIDHPEIIEDDGITLIPFNTDSAEWLRILSFNPTQRLNIGPRPHGRTGFEGYASAVNERMGFYEKLIPIKKWRKADGTMFCGPDPADGSTRILSPDGTPDTSFRCILPADQPFTFQLLDIEGEAIYGTTARTWHQGRPQEKREDCQGCHSHNKPDQTSIADTAAYSSDYPLLKLDKIRTVEYSRDIKEFDERLALNIGPMPWAVPGQESSINPFWKAYGSQKNTADNDPRLTAVEARLLRDWQNTGMMAAWKFADGSPVTEASGHGPYADTVPPTLCLKTYADKTLIGAADPQSGVNWASLQVLHNGTDIAGQFTREGDVLTGPAVDGVVTVSIRDRQHATGAADGNITKLVRTVTVLPDPPPPPPPPNPNQAEIDALNAERQTLERQKGEIESRLLEIDLRLMELEN